MGNKVNSKTHAQFKSRSGLLVKIWWQPLPDGMLRVHVEGVGYTSAPREAMRERVAGGYVTVGGFDPNGDRVDAIVPDRANQPTVVCRQIRADEF